MIKIVHIPLLPKLPTPKFKYRRHKKSKVAIKKSSESESESAYYYLLLFLSLSLTLSITFIHSQFLLTAIQLLYFTFYTFTCRDLETPESTAIPL